MAIKLYKIRKKCTNLFSSGSCVPRWTTRGKAWTSLAHIQSHLSNLARCWPLSVATYANAEVVEFEVTEKATQDTAAVLQQALDRKAATAAKALATSRRRQEAAEREQLRVLQGKYPSTAA